MRDIQDFDSIKIKLASPDDIRNWSYGEVWSRSSGSWACRGVGPELHGDLEGVP